MQIASRTPAMVAGLMVGGFVTGLLAGTFGAAPTPAAPMPAAPMPAAPIPTAATTTYVHVLLAERTAPALHAMLLTHPLFHHLPAGTVDPRARWMRVATASPAAAAALAASLATSPGIANAFVEPAITLPYMQRYDDEDPSCPITTPSYASNQGYLGPAPFGIDAPAAWRRGVLGAGVWFADIEGNWNDRHEDLDGSRITHVAGQRIRGEAWRAHGTAVLGEVVGKDNGRGVVGIAPAVDRVLTASFDPIGVAEAIDATAEAMRAGDVLLIELQGLGPRGRYLPVEYWPDVYDAVAAATARGVVVVEAAGNGGENLDLAAYDGAFDRTHHDSGAIMVGAGGPARTGYDDRARLDFSNYGSRLDVQGWGRQVATLDYGDLQHCSDAVERHYTDQFSGTSSASPIVAGAAVLLESAARASGAPLMPREVRALLTATGSPQTGNTNQAIGPRPDLARAFDRLGR